MSSTIPDAIDLVKYYQNEKEWMPRSNPKDGLKELSYFNDTVVKSAIKHYINTNKHDDKQRATDLDSEIKSLDINKLMDFLNTKKDISS